MTTVISTIAFVALWAWAVAHQLAIFYFFCVAVDQLPKPTGNSPVYSYFFGLTHFVAANWNRAKMGIMVKSSNGDDKTKIEGGK